MTKLPLKEVELTEPEIVKIASILEEYIELTAHSWVLLMDTGQDVMDLIIKLIEIVANLKGAEGRRC